MTKKEYEKQKLEINDRIYENQILLSYARVEIDKLEIKLELLGKDYSAARKNQAKKSRKKSGKRKTKKK